MTPPGAMSDDLLATHAAELRSRVAALATGFDDPARRDERRADAHRLRGSALVLGLDGVAVAVSAYEAALGDVVDDDGARRAAALALRELDRELEPDHLRPVRHDLRNDLNVILMGARLLESTLDDPELRRWAVGIAESAERMTERISELRVPDRIEAPPAVADAASLLVLVVEDDEVVAGVMRRMLGLAGARVETVDSLAGARAAITAQRYDAAVVDLRLRDGSGADLVPELHARGVRTVVVSGDGPVAIPDADAVLPKPVDAAVLVAAVTGETRS